MEFVIGMVAVVALAYCMSHYQEWIKKLYKSTVEMRLKQAQELFDEGTITEEEHQALRKKILGI